MPTPIRHVTAYQADTFKSLEELRGSCQRDEGDLTSKIVSINKATIDGVPGTAFTFEEVNDFGSVGHDLVAATYKDETDRQSQMTLHVNVQKETFLCGEQAYINSNLVNVLMFRAKPK